LFQNAIKERNEAEIHSAILAAERSIFLKYLEPEIQEANKALEKIKENKRQLEERKKHQEKLVEEKQIQLKIQLEQEAKARAEAAVREAEEAARRASEPPPPPSVEERASIASLESNAEKFANQQKDMDKVKEEVNSAISRKDIKSLRRVISRMSKDMSYARVLWAARENLHQLEMERGLLSELQESLGSFDIPRMKELLDQLTEYAIAKPDDPLIEETRRICYSTPASELFALRFRNALEREDLTLVKQLLPEAKSNGAKSDDIQLATLLVAQAQSKKLSQVQSMSPQSISHPGKFSEVFNKYRNAFSLVDFPKLRTVDNYTKNLFFNKSKFAHSMVKWQQDPIPRSLTLLSTSSIGGKGKSKVIKFEAKQIFKDIQIFMRDKYHPQPNSVVQVSSLLSRCLLI
jgi:hypothetical protein